MRELLMTSLLCTMVLVCLSGCGPEVEESVTFTKITDTADVPVKILENIRDINERGQLQRGLWEFRVSDYYETDYLYFMICGGRDYAAGYDADVTGFDMRYKGPSPAYAPQYSALFGLRFSETVDTDSTDYSEGLEYPVVLFRVDPYFGPNDRLNSSFSGDEALFIQRNFPQTIEISKIADNESLPVEILSYLSEVKLDKGAWEFKVEAAPDEPYLYYMICGGSEYADEFDVDTRVIKYNFGDSGVNPLGGNFAPYLTEMVESGITSYSQGLKYPVVIFRIDTVLHERDTVVEIVTADDHVLPLERVDLTN